MPINQEEGTSRNPFLDAVIQNNAWNGLAQDGVTLNRYYSIRIAPGTDPKQIDVVWDDREAVCAGIYKVRGDTLTLCITTDSNTPIRPTRFYTRQDLPIKLYIYERVKGTPEGSSPATESSPRP